MKSQKDGFRERFEDAVVGTGFLNLPEEHRQFIVTVTAEYRFTFQEIRQIAEMAVDFFMWDEPSIVDLWPETGSKERPSKTIRQEIIKNIRTRWNHLKELPNNYEGFVPTSGHGDVSVCSESKEKLGFGNCPVASDRTRCCNLKTLDAVESCGYDCSYCTIQSFYNSGRVCFDSSLEEKLGSIEFDPNEIYHIGTGQSSDSLMWGNQYGLLDTLTSFARDHRNVILEMKTKSANTHDLLKLDVPPNIICTWTVNTPTIVRNEERGTALLEDRLAAARRVADRGLLVGFHFHPMVYYSDCLKDYRNLSRMICALFQPEEVAMVSFGTLTYIKPVIKQIRRRGIKTKTLQMPLVETSGKLSYPDELKEKMFRCGYESFDKWHRDVFFYLCMEPPGLWESVFGYDYSSNEEFESAMKSAYMDKIMKI